MAAALMPAERPTPAARIKAALWFAERGFGIFPCWSTNDDGVCRCPDGTKCSSPGKHPITYNGFKNSTTDPDRIRTQLSAGSDPNYGMLPPEGVFAWDVDEEDDGIAKLARLEEQYGPLPATLRTNTAHGQHVFLRWPEGVPRPLKKMFGYVTRWGTGSHQGYVIGPRSVHASGAVYVPAIGALEIAEIPERWVRGILDGESAKPITVGGELPEVGGRHDWLRDRARFFRGFMDSKETLRAALIAENERLPQPKTTEEVERAIGRVFEQFPLDPVEDQEERVSRRLNEDEVGLLGPRSTGKFPDPPPPAAFRGLLGECIFDIARCTDASLVGLLGSLAAFCGALIPGSAPFAGQYQTSSPFIALVGVSGDGRKTTAMRTVRAAMETAIEPTYVSRVVVDGVSSGEGLVSHLEHKQNSYKYEPTVGLIYEEEYANLMAARGRDGSTLDPKLRTAFDGGPLSNRRSNDTKTVNPPYWLPGLIAITPDELVERTEAGALKSGSANRWLYLAVHRRPDRGTNAMPELSRGNRVAIVEARKKALDADNRPLDVPPAVRDLLSDYQDFVSKHEHGVSLDLSRRLAVIAFRIGLIHALVERSREVTMEHLERALALTEYGRRGLPWVFGETVGSPDADLLLRHLVAAKRLTKRAISQEIIRRPTDRQKAIDELERLGHARVVNVETGGRPRTELVWTGRTGAFDPFEHLFATAPEMTSDESEQKVTSEHETLEQKPEISPPKASKSPSEGTVTCHFYADHQFQHRWSPTADRFICPICSPEVEA